MSNPKPPLPRVARAPKWSRRCAMVVVTLFLLYQVPIIEYLWRVGASLADTGFSRKTAQRLARDSDWFIRYFTGPPSDTEMRAFFEKNRPTFERLAYLYATAQCEPGPEDKTCKELAQQLGVFVFTVDYVKNTIYPQSQRDYCFPACAVQNYALLEEAQNWWRSTNTGISSWEKQLYYVPPLLPAQPLGLNPKEFPAERDEVMRRLCRYPGASLDTLVPELERERYYSDACGYRSLGDGWYLALSAGYNLEPLF